MAAKERPILYGRPMVHAYFADLKTQTRRIVKSTGTVAPVVDPWKDWGKGTFGSCATDGTTAIIHCPYGAPGDLLRGKENAWIWCRKEREGLTKTGRPKYLYIPVGQHVIYQNDHPGRPTHRLDESQDTGWRLKIGRYLPKWACRMRSEVVSVRVERAQSISDADAIAEGVKHWAASDAGMQLLRALKIAVPDRPKFLFQLLWVSINGQESWDSNPWVWAVEFKRAEMVSQ